MSTDDATTSRDPEATDMVFGRPPTRPGYRNAATGDGTEVPEPPAGAEDLDPPDPPVLGAPGGDDTGTVESRPGNDPIDVDSWDADDPSERPDPPGADPTPLATPEGTDSFETDATPEGTDSLETDPPEDLDPTETETVPMEPHVSSAGAQVDVDPEPEASPAALGGEPALDEDQLADLRRRWAAVQTGFVDDPRRAVEVADDMVAEAVGALQAAIDDRRRAMAGPWQDDADASTDALLTAFQAYRAVFDRVLAV